MKPLAEQLTVLSSDRRALFERMLAERKAQDGQYNGHASVDPAASSLPPLRPDPQARHQPFPLTDIQQAQWIGGRSGAFELGKVAAHLYVEFDSTNLDVPRLERAWQRLIEEHDQLRMVIQPGDLKQRVLAEVPPYQIATLDLRKADPARREPELMAIRERMSHQVLPGDRWPLFEVRASLLDGGRVRVHVSFDLLVADAWSFRVLMDRWMQLYHDPALPQPKLELCYRDYVLHLDQMKGSELHQRSLAYWRERLPKLYPPPELPLCKHPRELLEQRSAHYGVRLSKEVWTRLREHAQRGGLTHSSLFLAAFAEVLSVYSKSPRFTINVTVFNRLPVHPQVNEILVGEFNSFVLLSVDLSQPEPFTARARRIQEQLWQDLEHRYVSGVQIMRELAQVTGRSTGALMPVVFTSTLAHYDEHTPTGWPGEMVYEVSQTPQIWMEHHIWEEEGALLLRCDAVDELFPKGMLSALFRSYERLLHRLADSEEGWLEEDRSYLVLPEDLALGAAVNATETKLPSGMLHDAFVAHAQRQPQHPAMISPSGQLSYKELDQRSNQLAHKLRELGAACNTLVAILMEPGPEQFVAVLGILKAGAAYLPIDPQLPEERLRYLLANGEVRVALTQPHLVSRLPKVDGVRLEAISPESLAAFQTKALAVTSAPTDLAYVIYTSGSTGQPKGVAIDHRSALNTIQDINQRFAVQPKDRVLSLSSLNFDLSVYDLLGMVAAGGTVVFPSAGEARDPSHWAQLLHKHQITLWNSVPALLEMQINYLISRKERLPDSLRLVLLSGDWIPVRLPEQARALCAPNCRFISLGGATEASIWSIFFPIDKVELTWRSIPYGKPLHNQRFYVLNEQLGPCPTWVAGQLYIAGAGLAQGYWRDPAKTQASFIRHPRSGERIYRTGDLGRYLPDGNIEFLGREDAQVKVLGHRIELGEIEAALEQHPEVRMVAVAAVGDSSQTRHLVAFIVPKTEPGPSVEQLSEHAQQRLPEYMVPREYHFLREMPITDNGKIDRKALARQIGVAAPREYVAPRTALEETVALIWSKVLNHDRVGVHDNFFELGGNSLLATQLIFQLRDMFQVEIPMARFFEATSLEKLAALIEDAVTREVEQLSDAEAERLLSDAVA